MLQLTHKNPPHDLAVEKSLLGAMLIDNSVIDIAAHKLKAGDFYSATHSLLYDLILGMHLEGEAVDLVTILNRLNTKGNLQKVGGRDYLMGLEESVPAVANAEYYAELIKDLAVRRSGIAVGHELANALQSGETPTKEILSAHEEAVCNLAVFGNTKIVTLRDTLQEVMATLEKAQHGILAGIPTRYKDLDVLLGGLHPGRLYVLAGRPSVGKSCFAWNLITRIGIDQNIPTLAFTLEVSAAECTTNVLVQKSRVDGWRILKAQLRDYDWVNLTNASEAIAEAPIYLLDTAGLSIGEVLSHSRHAKLKHNVGFIVVDYLQLMDTQGRESREQAIAAMSRELKKLARELEIPVLAVSQLNRGVEYRENKRPLMSDLRESGSIEQDADVVILMYRDDYYHPESLDKGIVELNIAKHRGGPTGLVKCLFIKDYLRFEDLAKEPVVCA